MAAISLPQVNRARQAKVFYEKIDISPVSGDNFPMKRPSVPTEPILYIGEWIDALGLKQKEVADRAGIGKSYLNLICKRTRVNPSFAVLQAIADAVELTIEDLKTPPPPSNLIEEIHRIPAGQIARLRSRRKTG